jgi:hypothetical protein
MDCAAIDNGDIAGADGNDPAIDGTGSGRTNASTTQDIQLARCRCQGACAKPISCAALPSATTRMSPSGVETLPLLISISPATMLIGWEGVRHQDRPVFDDDRGTRATEKAERRRRGTRPRAGSPRIDMELVAVGELDVVGRADMKRAGYIDGGPSAEDDTRQADEEKGRPARSLPRRSVAASR